MEVEEQVGHYALLGQASVAREMRGDWERLAKLPPAPRVIADVQGPGREDLRSKASSAATA